ncbi:MAG: glycoside hydrolase [Ruminococcus sp.]|nr:glycoside hydrolase [Ruminococcus sp.]
MKTRRFITAAFAAMIAAASVPFTGTSAEGNSYDMNVSVDLGGETKEISPYIYGVNQYGNEKYLKDLNVNSIRQGGNRMTAYNWENNASNAGSDWKHSSDDNLSKSDRPADCVQVLSDMSQKNDIDYKLTTLQLAGYVAADKDGPVSEEEKAPSDRWNQVVYAKNAPFDEEPDLTDGKVYMDEYVNYIIGKLGDSKSATGIQGYSLDNEPALWAHTHSRMRLKPVGVQELSDISIETAAAVKKLDPNAEIFGPALYGYTAYDHLADDENSDEWETIKAQGGYHWYLDYYLDRMKQAEETTGTRLLDVLDIHYYSESSRVGAEDRVQSVRTLYEKGFVENSWIGQWCQENVPILPTVQNSIDTYYPGTKLGITEYNFGGEDLSGTIAQAEALGCYADANVYFATLWSGNPFIYAGIKLYTNYDGNGGSFGDTLVPTKTDDVSLASSYAAINGADKGTVSVMLTNKSFTQEENASISMANADTNYEAAAVYAVSGDSSDIRLIDIVENVDKNTVNVTLPALSAAMVIVTDDASDFDGLTVYDPDAIVEETVTIDNPEDYINDKGYVVIPVEDAEHLKNIKITADVSTELGSSWGSAGCAVCINAKDKDGVDFWTSKSYQLSLGTGSTATVDFDGTFDNDGETVEGTIADGKVELQKWWDASEKQEEGDVVNVTYKSIQLTYEYAATKPETLMGDANCDGQVTIADSTAILQSLGNPDKYSLSEQGALNADVIDNGDGVKTSDALAIQAVDAKLIQQTQFPMTQAEYDAVAK